MVQTALRAGRVLPRVALFLLVAENALGAAGALGPRRTHVACFQGHPTHSRWARERLVAFRIEALAGEAPPTDNERCFLVALAPEALRLGHKAGATRLFPLPSHGILPRGHVHDAFADHGPGAFRPGAPTLPRRWGNVTTTESDGNAAVVGAGLETVTLLDLVHDAVEREARSEATAPAPAPLALVLETLVPLDDDDVARITERMEAPLRDAELLAAAAQAVETEPEAAEVLARSAAVLRTLAAVLEPEAVVCDAGEPEVTRTRDRVLYRSPGITARAGAAEALEEAMPGLAASFGSPWSAAQALLSKVCGVAALLSLAEAPGATHVSPVRPFFALNGEANFVVQSGVDGFTPMWDRGLLGTGEVIGVGDTGLDQRTCFMRDAHKGVLAASTTTDVVTDLTRRKVVQYVTFSGGDEEDVSEGHGTHVVGTALGAIEGSSPGDTSYDGVAFGAKVAFFDLQDSASSSDARAIFIPGDTGTIFAPAFDDAGARLHSNSWGGEPPTLRRFYDSNCREVDRFAYDHEDMLVLFAAGNCGETGCSRSGDSSVLSPALAKNVLAVGASHTGDGAYTSNADRVAYFSSRGCSEYDDNDVAGPCRIKPDVLGPGYVVRSAAADPGSSTCSVYTSLGTSMATPVIAGGAALVREYFKRGFYPFGYESSGAALEPSGPLVKAMLVASAVGVSALQTSSGATVSLGSPPDNIQGHGRVKLDEVLFFQSGLRLFVEDRAEIAEGEVHQYDLETVAGSDAARFTATLVWNEPGDVTSSYISTDLDLRVETGSGGSVAVHHPNGLSQADRVNNVEKVYVSLVGGETYRVYVTATTVASAAPWRYSLVVTGDFVSAPGLVAPPTSAPVQRPTPSPTGAPTSSPTLAPLYRVAATSFLCDAQPSDSVTAGFQQGVSEGLTTTSGTPFDPSDVVIDAAARATVDEETGTIFVLHLDLRGPRSDAEPIHELFTNATRLAAPSLAGINAALGEAFPCLTFFNATLSAVSDTDDEERPSARASLGRRSRAVLIYFQTAVGLTALSGFSLLVVLVLLFYSAWVGCCRDSQRGLGVDEMPHLWTRRFNDWQHQQVAALPLQRSHSLRRQDSRLKRNSTWGDRVETRAGQRERPLPGRLGRGGGGGGGGGRPETKSEPPAPHPAVFVKVKALDPSAAEDFGELQRLQTGHRGPGRPNGPSAHGRQPRTDAAGERNSRSQGRYDSSPKAGPRGPKSRSAASAVDAGVEDTPTRRHRTGSELQADFKQAEEFPQYKDDDVSFHDNPMRRRPPGPPPKMAFQISNDSDSLEVEDLDDANPELVPLQMGRSSTGQTTSSRRSSAGRQSSADRERQSSSSAAMARAIGPTPAALKARDAVRARVHIKSKRPFSYPTPSPQGTLRRNNDKKVTPAGPVPVDQELLRKHMQRLGELGATREEAVDAVMNYSSNQGTFRNPGDAWFAALPPQRLRQLSETASPEELEELDRPSGASYTGVLIPEIGDTPTDGAEALMAEECKGDLVADNAGARSHRSTRRASASHLLNI